MPVHIAVGNFETILSVVGLLALTGWGQERDKASSGPTQVLYQHLLRLKRRPKTGATTRMMVTSHQ